MSLVQFSKETLILHKSFSKTSPSSGKHRPGDLHIEPLYICGSINTLYRKLRMTFKLSIYSGGKYKVAWFK